MSSTRLTIYGELALPIAYQCPYCTKRHITAVHLQYSTTASRPGILMRQRIKDEMQETAQESLQEKMYNEQERFRHEVNANGNCAVFKETFCCPNCKLPLPWSGMELNKRPVWIISLLLGIVGAFLASPFVFLFAILMGIAVLMLQVYHNAKRHTALQSLSVDQLPFVLSAQNIQQLKFNDISFLTARAQIPNNISTTGKNAYIRFMAKDILKPIGSVLIFFGVIAVAFLILSIL